MFSKASKGSSASTSTPKGTSSSAAPSFISTDMNLVGDLSSEGEVQIDGTVNGDIRTKILLIGEKAIIRGEIIADTVKVHGEITGQIKARSVTLARTARMVGDILHENLAIEEGAFLEGHCKRMEKAEIASAVNLVVKEGGAAAKPPSTGNDPKSGKAAAG
ncbi:MAG: polymer-forming cytoskeletal protein [Rhodospirillales bacterium]|nr:polymer-forming cytoskeletal protein [Rhodospirillales bacterium]